MTTGADGDRLRSSLQLANVVRGMLSRSAFSDRKTWPFAVVVLTLEEQRVTTRDELASWFRANDLKPSARECKNRRVRSGEVLAWLAFDLPGMACAGFVVVPVAPDRRPVRP